MHRCSLLALACALTSLACAHTPATPAAEVRDASSEDTSNAPAMDLSAFYWGRRGAPFYACMLRESEAEAWRRTAQRTSWDADDFVARTSDEREDPTQVHVSAFDHGGVIVQMPPTADTCGLHLDYSHARVVTFLVPSKGPACPLDFAVTGQSYWVEESRKSIDVGGTYEDLDAFLAGGATMRVAIEQDITELRATAVGLIAAGYLQRLLGHDGCLPEERPLDAKEQRELLARVELEIARRLAALDTIERVRAHVLAEVPCLTELAEPAAVAEIARRG